MTRLVKRRTYGTRRNPTVTPLVNDCESCRREPAVGTVTFPASAIQAGGEFRIGWNCLPGWVDSGLERRVQLLSVAGTDPAPF